MSFTKRIFGCAIIRSINSNYNADFSHQPRTLPNGVVYATDKALKYTIKNFIKDNYPDEKVFFFKRLNTDFTPFSLNEAYAKMFPSHAEVDKNKNAKVKATKAEVAKDILECIDIRLFGATFALKGTSKEDNVAISVHGPAQINHGINIWGENNIFSEQIMSPFRNPGEQKGEDEDKPEAKAATTLGRQSKLQEGHYLHHFSVNPQNLSDITNLAKGSNGLSENDVDKLKTALTKGATYYDSAAKAGTDNELLLWIELKENSKLVLPNFTGLVSMEKENDTVHFNFDKVKTICDDNRNEIDKIEVYYLNEGVKISNLPKDVKTFDLISGKELIPSN